MSYDAITLTLWITLRVNRGRPILTGAIVMILLVINYLDSYNIILGQPSDQETLTVYN